jgi:tetratricopeptide (TPR) repeat protein
MKSAGVATLIVVTASMAFAPRIIAQRTAVTGGARVARTYDAIMDARFADVPPLLDETCPPAPAEVCQLLALVSLWWQIQLDPHNRTHDDMFQKLAAEVVATMETWTEREPMRAEAWFYLGGAIGARAQWRVLRGQMLAAAREGKRVKSSLERALALNPDLQDAYFGIGLYHYYAAVAPTAAKMLRWLFLLPGGNREQGLGEMLRARGGGQLLRGEADYQLHLIYLWYEKQPQRALDLLSSLSERHPGNPHFIEQIANIQDGYANDHAASLRTWQRLLERARQGRVAVPEMAAARAQLGIALELYHESQPEAAIPHLRAVIDSRSQAPVGAEAVAQLQLGYVDDRLGRREDAIAAYRAALAANPAGDPLKLEQRARAGLQGPLR